MEQPCDNNSILTEKLEHLCCSLYMQLSPGQLEQVAQRLSDLALVKSLETLSVSKSEQPNNELMEPSHSTYTQIGEGTLDNTVVGFIRNYNLDLPSSLESKARKVYNAEPSLAGFEFEDYLAAAIVTRYKKNEALKCLSGKFTLHDYIKTHADSDCKRIYEYFINDCDEISLKSYPGILDLPDRSAFLEYCRLRVPGVGKPAGGTQAIGPDLCMWLKDDVFLVLASKISKQAFKHCGNSPEKKKALHELTVSRKEVLDNVFSMDIDHYGVAREKFKKSPEQTNSFSDTTKGVLFGGSKPMKVYIQVNSVLPFSRTHTTGQSEVEYTEAIDSTVRVKKMTAQVDENIYEYYRIRVNLSNDNYIESGLLSEDEVALEYFKKLFFYPLEYVKSKK